MRFTCGTDAARGRAADTDVVGAAVGGVGVALEHSEPCLGAQEVLEGGNLRVLKVLDHWL